MEVVAHDPHADPAAAQELGVAVVGLEELLTGAHVVCVNCPLTEETRGLMARASWR